jgi:hypothetical protein
MFIYQYHNEISFVQLIYVDKNYEKDISENLLCFMISHDQLKLILL